MKTNDTEIRTIANNEEQKGVSMNADNFEVSEKKSEGNMDKYIEMKDETKVEVRS
jgi:hypothetical protein